MPVNEKADPSREEKTLSYVPSPSPLPSPGTCWRMCSNRHNLGCQLSCVMPYQMQPNVHARPLRARIRAECFGVRPFHESGGIERHVSHLQIIDHRM